MLLLDGPAIAAELRISAATIRQWGQRRRIARHGRDAAGRWLYDFDEVGLRATRAGLTDRWHPIG